MRIAVLGAGHVGPVIARVAVEAGYDVSIAASGDPARIELITQVIVPGAKALWAADAAADADLVVLAIPLHKFAAFDPAIVEGKLVIDTMNYWPPVDGVQELFENPLLTSSEVVQQKLSRSTVVKTFNHLGYHELADDRREPGDPDRRAMGIAGTRPATRTVAEVIDAIGYAPVILESLAAGRLLQPGGPAFGIPLQESTMQKEMQR
ncbi:NAD(P)-binding domain-containing protein [Kribbella koreensis]|uniref:NAD(P)-binding domain-containing protein n=1 Tax=Kribbella koreensis TaxID=57909 RepID=A0ABN1RSP8_9ACTN